MCGIWCSLGPTPRHPSPHALNRLRARGPDSLQSVTIPVRSGSAFLTIYVSVLALRHEHGAPVPQPLLTPPPPPQPGGGPAQTALGWNGEAWRIDGAPVPPGHNDTLLVRDILSPAAEAGAATVRDRLGDIDGPWAFVYYHGPSATLYFGRDPLGRRSLVQRQEGDALVIASVSSDDHKTDGSPTSRWSEVEADGLYTLQLGQTAAWPPTPTHYPYLAAGPLGAPSLLTTTIQPPALSSLETALRASIQTRLPPSREPLAILFSGGLDCSLLARLAHDFIPPEQPVDLLNVVFESPRWMQAHAGSGASRADAFAAAPDRSTALSSSAKLAATCARPWRLIQIDVPFKQYKAHRSKVVSLMRPHATEMDLSIGAALYFAARGRGTATLVGRPDPPQTDYTTAARTVFSGLGADELFGGYSRHRIAFERGSASGDIPSGYAAVDAELQLDFDRLGKRNLGRDDRVISDSGREARYPFLDSAVVEAAAAMSAIERCPFSDPDGKDVGGLEPAKRPLRLMALRLGLPTIAAEKKRAIQFGARTAKMEIGSGRKRGTMGVE